MSKIIPKITIDDREVPYLDGKYQLNGSLTAATLQFTLPLSYASYKKLWNKEVTFFLKE